METVILGGSTSSVYVLLNIYLSSVQDGKVEQKWKWPLGRIQTTVAVQVSIAKMLPLVF